jgi:hypothetical protein
MLILKQILPIELTNGNAGRGYDWQTSARFRKLAEKIIRAHGWTRKPFEVPVTVRVTRLFRKGQRPWDSSSIGRGNWKEIEDALVACGWFHDDCHRWIRRTEFEQAKHTEACVMVEIFKFEERTSAK